MSLGFRLSSGPSSCNLGGAVESAEAPVGGRFCCQNQEVVKCTVWKRCAHSLQKETDVGSTPISTSWPWAHGRAEASVSLVKGHYPTSQDDSGIT